MNQHTNKRILQPYLSFEGRCEEALEFYRKSIGAEVTVLLRHRDSPDPGGSAPDSLDKVMHASVRIGESTVLASDGRCGGKPNFQGIWLALTAPDEADAQRLFDALADGGKVQLPLTRTFFSPRFGIVTDCFGVSWMIQAAPQGQK
jgi:PhnB protein